MEAMVAQLHQYEVLRLEESEGLSEKEWGCDNDHGIEIAAAAVDTTHVAQQKPQLKRKRDIFDDEVFVGYYLMKKKEREERKEYKRQVEKSGGFDVDDFSHLELAHMIRPVSKSSFKSCYDKIKDRTMLAIDHYNDCHQDSKKIEFSQVLKVNYSSYPLKHYITFEAKASNAADADIDVVNVFQTLIISARGDLGFVKFCRRKRPSSHN